MKPFQASATIVLLLAILPFTISATARKRPSIVQPALNVSSLGVISESIDPRFNVDDYYSNTPIDQDSCLMVAVNEMANLALLPWNGRTRGYRSAILPKYPNVLMEVIPQRPAKEIENRFLIWGINIAMYNIIHDELFVESSFEISMSARVIGWIRFRRQDPVHLTLPGHENPNNASSDTANLMTNRFAAIVASVPNAKRLDKLSVFITIYDALKAIAHLPSTVVVGDPSIDIAPLGLDVKAEISSTDDARLPRIVAPFLEGRWIVETMRKITEWMLDRVFEEVGVEITVDGFLVGVAKILGKT